MTTTIQNYINGEFVAPRQGQYLDSFNPATGKVHVKVPDSDEEDTLSAIAAAKAAFPMWSSTSRSERSKWLNKIADGIEARIDEFAEAESQDQGKPVWLARKVDIPRVIHNFRFFAGVILYDQNKSTIQEEHSVINYTTRTPLGVAGLITPWNLPLYLLSWKIAPALATGNVVVAKPSEFTSLTAFLMTQVMRDIALPAGICNIVYGLGTKVGATLVTHPDVPLISFTGGTVTGRRIAELSAPRFKKLSLELGGKNPAIIFDDVDIDHVVAETIRSSFTNQGEICLCSSRIYVHAKIYDQYLTKLVAGVRALKVGSPRDADTRLGPLVSKEHLAKVRSYVDIAREEGATLHCGHTVDAPLSLPDEFKEGYFMQPTVISDVTDSSRCVQEEIFGPVLTVMKFEDENNVIERANGTEYGLSASIWSVDGIRAHRVANKIHAGIVWINCWLVRDLNMPFGGMKLSGTGREGADDSLHFFTEAKTICSKF